MKFRIDLDGKDSAADALCVLTSQERQRILGREYTPDFDGDSDPGWKELHEKLKQFVGHFVCDGKGGYDSVTLEFDTEAGTCGVVPLSMKKREQK